MNEFIPSSVQPPQAAQKPRTWLRVKRDLGRAAGFTLGIFNSATQVPITEAASTIKKALEKIKPLVNTPRREETPRENSV